MTANKVLEFLAMSPDSANYFGISDNFDMRLPIWHIMFGVGELTGQKPQGQYVWFWGTTNIPANIPDFVYNTGDTKVYGYILD